MAVVRLLNENDHQNWFFVEHGFSIVSRPFQMLMEMEMTKFHTQIQDILRSKGLLKFTCVTKEGAYGCSNKNKDKKKRKKAKAASTWCAVCLEYKQVIEKKKRNNYEIIWKNSNSGLWDCSSAEIAKCFIYTPTPATEFSKFDLTPLCQITGACTLIENIDLEIVKSIQNAKNKYKGHNVALRMTSDEREDVFSMLEKLLTELKGTKDDFKKLNEARYQKLTNIDSQQYEDILRTALQDMVNSGTEAVNESANKIIKELTEAFGLRIDTGLQQVVQTVTSTQNKVMNKLAEMGNQSNDNFARLEAAMNSNGAYTVHQNEIPQLLGATSDTAATSSVHKDNVPQSPGATSGTSATSQGAPYIPPEWKNDTVWKEQLKSRKTFLIDAMTFPLSDRAYTYMEQEKILDDDEFETIKDAIDSAKRANALYAALETRDAETILKLIKILQNFQRHKKLAAELQKLYDNSVSK